MCELNNIRIPKIEYADKEKIENAIPILMHIVLSTGYYNIGILQKLAEKWVDSDFSMTLYIIIENPVSKIRINSALDEIGEGIKKRMLILKKEKVKINE